MLWGQEQCVIRNHLTQKRNSSYLFFSHLIHTEREKRDRQRQRETGRRREEEEEWEEGEGRQRKVWTPAPLWPVKITLWAFRVSEDEGGRGIGSVSARLGTAHAWLTLWIPTELNLYALSSFLVSDSESVSKPIILFVSDIIDLCMRAQIRVFESVCLNGKPPGVFLFSFADCSASSTNCLQSLSGKRSFLS